MPVTHFFGGHVDVNLYTYRPGEIILQTHVTPIFKVKQIIAVIFDDYFLPLIFVTIRPPIFLLIQMMDGLCIKLWVGRTIF